MKIWWVVVLVVGGGGGRADRQRLLVGCKRYGGRDEDQARSIRATADGGYCWPGTATDEFGGAILLVRTDSLGQRAVAAADRRAALPGRARRAGAGGRLCPGGHGARSTEREYPFLMRLMPQGEALWTQVYEAGGRGGAHAVRALEDGGFALAGWSAPDPARADGRAAVTHRWPGTAAVVADLRRRGRRMGGGSVPDGGRFGAGGADRQAAGHSRMKSPSCAPTGRAHCWGFAFTPWRVWAGCGILPPSPPAGLRSPGRRVLPVSGVS